MARPRITVPLLIGALGALAVIIAAGVAGWLVINDLEAKNQSSGDAAILADLAVVNKLFEHSGGSGIRSNQLQDDSRKHRRAEERHSQR